MLSAIRNITDKDDGPSEPPWTAAKSALEQDATRAGLPSCSVESTVVRS
ncbi:hypothetical protein [Yersinia enterocolitica]|nr:hypothetical protein [Yersinia enterocolitica]HDL7861284.1 hypothetical protein [Yersinia enterocolitica]HEI6796969.1 hypothetical protein [Yersinia enterocolitica]HEI6813339.1 hypothetical protein [Yersinia enterocolitica]HEI6918354.1 hypothetical protein [Yersinia enterocolitica]